MIREQLQTIIDKHQKWVNNEAGGKRANLSGANLSGADLSCADLRRANLSGANLSCADLRRAYLSGADLSGANLRDADLSGANLRDANLSGADLSCADLRRANLRDANLSGANLSGADGLLSAIDYLDANFERTADGYIAYKTFGGQYPAPDKWEIKAGSIITETVNPDRCTDCGSGVNVAPLEWVRSNYKGDVWKCLIRWEWIAGVIVPYMTDGKIRCERVELIEVVK